MENNGQHEFAVTADGSASPYIVIAASKSEAREMIESRHLRVMWVELRRSQCDRCKTWHQPHTMKTQAGVTFCAKCQSDFIDWIDYSISHLRCTRLRAVNHDYE